jgi:CPA1 family monovalent cation:H+ antiporter
MTISSALMWLAVLLLIAILIKPLVAKWHLPFAAILIAIGFIGSEMVVMAGYDTGIRYHSFHDLIFYVFLPLLIFQAAFTLDVKAFLENWLLIILLALPLMLLATVISALLIFWGIGHPVGFPLIAALLTGVLLSATDPAAVVGMMRELGAPKRLCTLLEGESLLNDAMAIVSFSILLQLALMPASMLSVSDALWRFVEVFFGGILVGVVMGGLASLLLKKLTDSLSQAVVTLAVAYLSFLFAEKILAVSGVMAVLLAGLILSHTMAQVRQSMKRALFVDEFWHFNVFVAEALMFLFMGVTITVAMFTDNWLAMLIAIAAVLIARTLMLFTANALVWPIKSQPTLAMSEQRLLLTGGLRGAVTLALVLSLPVELSYWWVVQSMAFGVVLFTFFIQAPLMPRLIKQAGR